MDGEITAEPKTRKPITIEPKGTHMDLTGPISLLSRETSQSESGKKFWDAANVLFAQSKSKLYPVTDELVANVVNMSITKTEELISKKGTYANTEEGQYADGWLIQLNGAKDVLEGRRADSRPLVAVIDTIAGVREQLARENAKGAGRTGLSITEDGRVILSTYANPASEKSVAESTLKHVKEENLETHNWVIERFGKPKNSW